MLQIFAFTQAGGGHVFVTCTHAIHAICQCGILHDTYHYRRKGSAHDLHLLCREADLSDLGYFPHFSFPESDEAKVEERSCQEGDHKLS